MARNSFPIFTENKPVRGLRKKKNIPDVNWLKTFPLHMRRRYKVIPDSVLHMIGKHILSALTDMRRQCVCFDLKWAVHVTFKKCFKNVQVRPVFEPHVCDVIVKQVCYDTLYYVYAPNDNKLKQIHMLCLHCT